jgi:hypothetical protein
LDHRRIFCFVEDTALRGRADFTAEEASVDKEVKYEEVCVTAIDRARSERERLGWVHQSESDGQGDQWFGQRDAPLHGAIGRQDLHRSHQTALRQVLFRQDLRGLRWLQLQGNPVVLRANQLWLEALSGQIHGERGDLLQMPQVLQRRLPQANRHADVQFHDQQQGLLDLIEFQ